MVTDDEIRCFLREVAIEGYEPDDELIRLVGEGLMHDHPGQPELLDRVRRLGPPLLDELRARESEWPIPTDNDRLDRAFVALERDGILARQNWYWSQPVAAEEMRHEVKAAGLSRTIRGYAYFPGGDTRRAIAGEGLRITWGASLPGKIARARLERASWEIAQDIHRALWAQHLAPSWSRVVGDPITLPFTWRRRRKRRRTPPAGKGS